MRVGKVDCTAEPQICERFGVQSYPTLKVIDQSQFYDYSGNREVNSLLEFVKTGYKVRLEDETPFVSDTSFIESGSRKSSIAFRIRYFKVYLL